MAVKYFIDKDKRTSVCLISVKKKLNNGKYHTFHFKGKAKCSPEDEFNEQTGVELSHLRALLKFKTWEQANHQNTIDFCKKAAEYYTQQAEKYEKYLGKTEKALTRLEKELDDIL